MKKIHSAPLSTTQHDVMPAPADVRLKSGRFSLTAAFSVAVIGAVDPRAATAVSRLLRRWEERTGLAFARAAHGGFAWADAAAARLVVTCRRAGERTPVLGEDESYQLSVRRSRVRLQAETGTGLLRGLATLEQWLRGDSRGWFLPVVEIADRPRFAWRGLLIDVCRHWQPLEAVKRQLDAMALVKLNVLHLHLTEDQGFRVESLRYPRLHQLGSDGLYYTQAQLGELVAYATERGIRVVPEFDVPGHVTSWLVGYPELGSAPGPYVIRRNWGVADPALDPTNEKVYEMLRGFLGEMARIFPDAYLHIGGDEVKSGQWKTNPRIQRFIREHGLKDNRGLQAYFNRRLETIVKEHGKQMVGWDEILHPNLPPSTVVQSWRGAAGLGQSAKLGFASILSNGYYIDLWWPAARHYAVDPVPEGSPLTADQQKLVLGGEATMWTEWTTPEKIDGCIWPRTAAIAERLWSPREVRDEGEMYRRLAAVSRRLEETGLRHEVNREVMLRRLAGDAAGPAELAALREIAAVFEPVKNYGRNLAQPDATQFLPLTGFTDLLRIESETARLFNADVQQFLFGAQAGAAALAGRIRRQLDIWGDSCAAIRWAQQRGQTRAAEFAPAALRLQRAVTVGLAALEQGARRKPAAAAWRTNALAILTAAAKPVSTAELALGRPLRLLVAAASLRQADRGAADWRQAVETAAKLEAPPAAPVYQDH